MIIMYVIKHNNHVITNNNNTFDIVELRER